MDIEKMEAGRELDGLIAETVMGFVDICSRHYSTDIKAAWTVVEKMAEHGWGPLICPIKKGEQWFCDPSQVDCDAMTAPTAPLAICLAALKAVERKREEKA